MIEKVIESENVIKSSAEIPQVLKEENVKQPVIYLSGKIKGKERKVVLLGETHIATKGEERVAKRILPYFKYIGCEGINVEEFIEGKFYFWLRRHIIDPFIVIIVTFCVREKRSNENKSFIAKASEYYDSETKTVLMLEEGWKPGLRTRLYFISFLPLLVIILFWIISSASALTVTGAAIARNDGLGWAIAPVFVAVFLAALINKLLISMNIRMFLFDFIYNYVFDIGPSREKFMIKNLVAALNEDESIDEFVGLTGSAHTRPMAKILKNKYGFVETDSYEPGGF